MVERDAEAWRPRLQHLHDGLFGPGKCDPLAPVCFDVIDRATHEALKRLEDAGLVTKTVRATRPLYPETTGETKLADEKKAEMGKIIEQIARKVKMARLLVSGDLGEEARSPLIKAVTLTGRCLALNNNLPLPETPEDALAAPLVHFWSVSTDCLRIFLENSTADPVPVLTLLENCAQQLRGTMQ